MAKELDAETLAIWSKMQDGFMAPEIEEGEWWEADSKDGGTYSYPAWIVSKREAADDCGAKMCDVRKVTGFGARLSASGYLDATDWTVYATEDDAIVALVDMYGDDIIDLDDDTCAD